MRKARNAQQAAMAAGIQQSVRQPVVLGISNCTTRL
jgi:hypothetical protein